MDTIDVLSTEPLELIAAMLGVILLVLAINSKHDARAVFGKKVKLVWWKNERCWAQFCSCI
jgi:hypothetical protein